MSRAKEIIEKVNEANKTEIVIADKVTGSMWGGIWTDPEGKEAQKKLKSVIKETGNNNYEIMSFSDAVKLEKKNKKAK
jgi:hypothetical protein